MQNVCNVKQLNAIMLKNNEIFKKLLIINNLKNQEKY